MSKNNYINILSNLLILYFSGIFFFALYKAISIKSPEGFLLILIFCFILAVVIILNKFFYKKLSIYVIIFLYPIIFSFYLFELYLITTTDTKTKTHLQLKDLAAQNQIQWDNRHPVEIFDTYRKKNKNFYPNYSPSFLFKLNKHDSFIYKQHKILPLGTISNSTTFLDNELGYYPIIQNDKFGFKNKNEDYNKNIDFILTGDSFVEGCCTNQDETIIAKIKQNGYKAISLGKTGTGPLVQYAIIKEYVYKSELKYDNLIWFFYTNDFDELEKELESNILVNYLKDDEYKQNLFEKQKIVDEIIRNYVLQEFEKQKTIFNNTYTKKEYNFGNSPNKFNLINFIKLSKTRNLLNYNQKHPSFKIFQEIIIKTKKIVEEDNAEFIFVYIPHIDEVSKKMNFPHKKNIFQFLNNTNVKIIDLTKIIEIQKEPLSIWPFQCCGHFNTKGTELLANYLLDNLK